MQCLCTQVPGTWHSPSAESYQAMTSLQHSKSFHRLHVSLVVLPASPHFKALLFNPVPKVIKSSTKWSHVSKTKNQELQAYIIWNVKVTLCIDEEFHHCWEVLQHCNVGR